MTEMNYSCLARELAALHVQLIKRCQNCPSCGFPAQKVLAVSELSPTRVLVRTLCPAGHRYDTPLLVRWVPAGLLSGLPEAEVLP